MLKVEDLGVSSQSLARIINKLKLTGSKEQMKRNDKTTSLEIQKKLAKHGLIVHTSTIQQSHKEQGWMMQKSWTNLSQTTNRTWTFWANSFSISFICLS